MFLEPNSIAAETGAVEYYLNDQAIISAPPPPRREVRTFDTPKSIWITMFASYAIFFMGLTIATGCDGITLMMIVISAGYAVIYFGTAIVMNNVDQAARPKQVPTTFNTHTGTIGYWAGFAQILTVPILIAAFSIAVAVIRSVVAP